MASYGGTARTKWSVDSLHPHTACLTEEGRRGGDRLAQETAASVRGVSLRPGLDTAGGLDADPPPSVEVGQAQSPRPHGCQGNGPSPRGSSAALLDAEGPGLRHPGQAPGTEFIAPCPLAGALVGKET